MREYLKFELYGHRAPDRDDILAVRSAIGGLFSSRTEVLCFPLVASVDLTLPTAGERVEVRSPIELTFLNQPLFNECVEIGV